MYTTAENMRILAQRHNENLESVLREIRIASNKGETYLEAKTFLELNTLEELKIRGFRVEMYYQNHDGSAQIRWDHIRRIG
jgi:hypothetical protein